MNVSVVRHGVNPPAADVLPTVKPCHTDDGAVRTSGEEPSPDTIGADHADKRPSFPHTAAGCGRHELKDVAMTFVDNRPALLQKARAVVEKAQREGRDRLTDAEQGEVNRALGEVRKIAATVEADAKSRVILDSLDAMAAGHYEQGAGQHIALTGPHMRTMAEKIIAASMRDQFGQKTLVTGGTSVVSQILLPEVIATGRPAQSVLDVLPSRIVPPSYSFIRQSSRALAAAPVAAYAAKPVSDVGVGGVQNRLRVIATISSAIDHYLLSDNTNLERFVTDELVYGVRVATENQVLNGDGTGENFLGVFTRAGFSCRPSRPTRSPRCARRSHHWTGRTMCRR